MSTDAEQLEQLTAYLDGELSDDQRAEVEKLIAEDEDARVLMEELRQTAHLLSGLPHESAPDDLTDAVTARLERQALLDEAPKKSGFSWVGKLAVAAGFVLACTIGWYTWPTAAPQGLEQKPITVADAKEDAASTSAEGEFLAIADKAEKLDRATIGRDRPSVRLALPERDDEKGTVDRKFASEPSQVETSVAMSEVDKDDMRSSRDSRGGPSLEAQLVSNQLTNAVVLNASLEAFDNRIRVETDDPASVAMLTDEIRKFASRESIPNARAEPLPEPIASDQAFYAIQERRADQPTAGLAVVEAEPPEEQLVVMHLPRKQAEELITSLQDNAVRSQARLQWTANNDTLPQAQPHVVSREVMKRIVVSREGSRARRAAETVGGSLGRAGGIPETRSESPKKDAGRDEPRPKEKIEATKKSTPVGNKLGQAGGTEKDRLTGTPGDADGEMEVAPEEDETLGADLEEKDLRRFAKDESSSFVTFVISLRSNVMLPSVFKSGTASPTTQRGATVSPPTSAPAAPPTSQPATQGTPRG